MGMFDSVFVKCPECGEEVEFQSKAGECILHTWRLEDAPPEVIEDIAYDVGCCEHNHYFTLMPPPFKSLVAVLGRHKKPLVFEDD